MLLNSPEDSERTLTLGALDRAFKQWMAIDVRDSEGINSTINAVGTALGQILVSELELRWVIATDQYGTDLAVFKEAGEVLVYPANFVAKRWERREVDFFETSFLQIAQTVSNLTAKAQPKPWWKF